MSLDDVPTQCSFAESLDVKFPMIADRRSELAHAYEVFFSFLPLVHRVTYVIDRDGVIAGVFNGRIGKAVCFDLDRRRGAARRPARHSLARGGGEVRSQRSRDLRRRADGHDLRR